MWFFHEVRGLRAHAQGALHLPVCNLLAPPRGLLVEVVPVGEGAARKEVLFRIGKISFDLPFPVSVPDRMGREPHPKDVAKPFHLRSDLCIGTRAVGHQDARVVDDTARAGAVHEVKRGIEKDPGLEAGEGRIVLDKEFSGVSEDQSRALSLSPSCHP